MPRPFRGHRGPRRPAVHRRLARSLGTTAIAMALMAGGAQAALTPLPGHLAVAPGRALTGVACPSASLCVASAGAQELTFDPLRFRRPVAHTLFTGRGLLIDGLWCPTTRACVAIDFQSGVSFDPRRPRPSRPVRLEPVTGEGLVAVRCPSRVECVAVDSFGDAITYDPVSGHRLRPVIKVDGDERLTALACPSTTECTALDDAGYEYTFQPRTGRSLGHDHIDPAVGLNAPSGASDSELDGVSCPTLHRCAAVDTLGNLITFDPLATGAAATLALTTMSVDPGQSLAAISCKRTGVCVAVDRAGNAVGGTIGSGTNAAPETWQLQPVAGAQAFSSVACPTTSRCIAVDAAGNAFPLAVSAT